MKQHYPKIVLYYLSTNAKSEHFNQLVQYCHVLNLDSSYGHSYITYNGYRPQDFVGELFKNEFEEFQG